MFPCTILIKPFEYQFMKLSIRACFLFFFIDNWCLSIIGLDFLVLWHTRFSVTELQNHIYTYMAHVPYTCCYLLFFFLEDNLVKILSPQEQRNTKVERPHRELKEPDPDQTTIIQSTKPHNLYYPPAHRRGSTQSKQSLHY